jgi:hypothetical protein
MEWSNITKIITKIILGCFGLSVIVFQVVNTIKGKKLNLFEEIHDISHIKDALSVWATRVMAAACSQPLPVLVTGASTQ